MGLGCRSSRLTLPWSCATHHPAHRRRRLKRTKKSGLWSAGHRQCAALDGCGCIVYKEGSGNCARAERFMADDNVFPDGAFADLIRRVRAGEQDAAAELVRRYEPA